MSKQNGAIKPPQPSLESSSDMRPNARTEVSPARPIQKGWLINISAQELLSVGSKGYSQQQLLEEVSRRLAIRRETMSAGAFARPEDPMTRYRCPYPFSAEGLAEVTLLGFINYAELTKPGGEAEQIAERYGGRALTDGEMKKFFDDNEEVCCRVVGV